MVLRRSASTARRFTGARHGAIRRPSPSLRNRGSGGRIPGNLTGARAKVPGTRCKIRPQSAGEAARTAAAGRVRRPRIAAHPEPVRGRAPGLAAADRLCAVPARLSWERPRPEKHLGASRRAPLDGQQRRKLDSHGGRAGLRSRLARGRSLRLRRCGGTQGARLPRRPCTE